MNTRHNAFPLILTFSAVFFIGLIGAVLVVPLNFRQLGYANDGNTSAHRPKGETVAHKHNLSDSVRNVAMTLRPSVVSITSVKKLTQKKGQQRFQQFNTPELPEQLREFFGDDGFDRFFRFPVPEGGLPSYEALEAAC